MTPEQLTALGNHIRANSEVNGDLGNLGTIRDWYNSQASPDFFVWKTSVASSEITRNSFDWTRVDNLSIGKARIWDWMFRDGPIDPTNSAMRDGINEVWKGTQADLNVRAVVYSHCYTLASNVGKLFSVGAGTVPDEDGDGPAASDVSSVTTQDIDLALEATAP